MTETASTSRILTLVFSDLADSMALKTRLGDQLASALITRHRAHVSTLAAGTTGRIIDWAGDGCFLTFDTPSAAVLFALRLQQAHQDEPDLPGVRIGMHMGEVSERPGPDGDATRPRVEGLAVDLAARISALARPAQILMSASVADSARQRLEHTFGQPIHWQTHGSYAVKGFDGDVEIREAGVEGIAPFVEPLKSTPATDKRPVPGNLPMQPTALLGRERHLTELTGLLSEHRLVTLTGVGGVGKTRLALQVATESATNYHDGAWVIEFASLRDAAATGHAVAGLLGIALQPGLTIEQSIVRWLRSRELLLVLDNCEHLLEPVADLAYDILAQCPGVTLIATSREALMLDGEHIWPVPSLGFRDGAESAAVALFLARARAVVPDFEPGDDVDAVSEICRRLDGIPLAIELAAARVRTMSPSQIRNRLEDSFRLLTGGSRRALERHQSLRQAVQWSIDLLTPAERTVLNRATVFAGEFTLEAAEHVCAGGEIEPFDVLDLMDSLVRKSLMLTVRTEQVVRHRLLETIRQFGEEQLVASGEMDVCRQRHARYFADDSVTHFRQWRSPRQLQAYLWLDREMDNLRLAFGWAKEHGNVDIAATIAASIGDMARFRMRDESRRWPEEIVDAARVTRHPNLIIILTWVASNAWGEERMEDAIRAGEEAIALLADPHFEPFVHIFTDLAVVARARGDHAGAVGFARDGAQHAADALDRLCLACLPFDLVGTGDINAAIQAAEAGVPVVEAAGVPHSVTCAYWALAEAQATHDPARAREYVKKACDLAEASGNRLLTSVIWPRRVVLEITSVDPFDALASSLPLIARWRDSSELFHVRQGLATIGLLFSRMGRLSQAAPLFGFLMDDFTLVLGQSEYDGSVRQMRAALGDAAFDAAQRAGAAFNLRQALDYAESQARLALAERITDKDG